MRAETSRHSLLGLALILLLPRLLLPSTAWAQQESTSASPQEQKTGRNLPTAGAEAEDQKLGESSSREDATPKAPEEPQIRQLGKAGPLRGNSSPLRWGSLYVGSAEFFQVYNSFRNINGTNDLTRNTSLFRTNIVFDHRFRRSRFAVQYQPRLAIVDGRALGNFANQDLDFEYYDLLSRRWTLSIRERFTFLSNPHVLGEDYLLADGLTGSTLQENFLDSANRWIQSNLSLGLGYALSARTQLTITPNYTYANTMDLANKSNLLNSVTAQQYGAGVLLTHALSLRKSVGLSYSVQRIKVSDEQVARVYQTLGVTYSQKLGSFWINTALGAVTDNPGAGMRRWGLSSHVSVVKSMRQSSLSLAYSRGQAFAGYVTANYSDRVDAGYGLRLTRRAQASFGAGYYRELGSGVRTSGKYALSNLSYRLFPSVSLFASFAHKFQVGGASQLLTGARDYFTTGIRWTPPILAR